MVNSNAIEQANQYKVKSEHDTRILAKLSEMLSLDALPDRIEAYDISNLGKEHITAGMIVYEDGKLQKSDYRVFKIKNQEGIDDYSAMREVIERRLSHLDDEGGSYAKTPDLILLDGGMTHVEAVKEVLEKIHACDDLEKLFIELSDDEATARESLSEVIKKYPSAVNKDNVDDVIAVALKKKK